MKKSLSARIASASVYTDSKGNFLIKLNGIFANMLSSSETDLSIVKGIIAEIEGKNPAEIRVAVETAEKPVADAFAEIVDALK